MNSGTFITYDVWLDETVRDDFAKARRKATFRRLLNWLRRQDNRLLSFDSVRECMTFGGQRDLGVRQVSIDLIVGSVGRSLEFDRTFLPRYEQDEHRWIQVDKAYHEGLSLPAVKLYKIGQDYFVEDGNHRISVARLHGQEYVEAHVIEIDAMEVAE